MEDVATRAYRSALKSLAEDRWLKDLNASENALRHNLMCMCGFEVDLSKTGFSRECFSGEEVDDVVLIAMTGDRIAHEALVCVARHLTERGKSLPLKLQDYIVGAAEKRPKFKRSRHKVSNLYRDHAIFNAVEKAIAEGLLLTRNRAAKKEGLKSACSVVAKALGDLPTRMSMSEHTVETIWRDRAAANEKAGFRTSRLVRN